MSTPPKLTTGHGPPLPFTVSSFHPCFTTSGECLRGKSPPDRMLAKPWRRLFLAAYTFWTKPGCCCCPAWQTVLYSWAVCLNQLKIIIIIKHIIIRNTFQVVFRHCFMQSCTSSIWVNSYTRDSR